MITENKMNLLKATFDILNVDYEIISDNEIRVPCPSDFANCELIDNMTTQLDIIADNRTDVINDESYVSIYIDNSGNLNWLVENKDYRD